MSVQFWIGYVIGGAVVTLGFIVDRRWPAVLPRAWRFATLWEIRQRRWDERMIDEVRETRERIAESKAREQLVIHPTTPRIEELLKAIREELDER